MVTTYRLVRLNRETHYGDVPLSNPFYVLQISHDQGEHWETCPVVLFEDLPQPEKVQIYKELSK